ncbi:MAG: hypothetical protein WD314_05230 [Trueperaceae bacterium]
MNDNRSKDRGKRTLTEVHDSEPDPFTDRQNFEPEPAAGEVEDDSAEYVDAETGEVDDETIELSDDTGGRRSRSDIREYAPRDTAENPAEDEPPRMHDDDDPWGDGIHDTPMVKRYEDMADRDELARRVEELVADAYDWLGRAEDADAQEIYDTLLDVSERLGNPSEETTRTEPGEPPPDRDETDA